MGSRLKARLLDSTIVIDALNGHAAAAVEILDAEASFISRVTWIEVLAGCKTEQTEEAAREVLSQLTVLEIDSAVSQRTVEVRRTTRLKLPDAIILATARVHGLTLSTRNTKDFDANDPSVRIPYEL